MNLLIPTFEIIIKKNKILVKKELNTKSYLNLFFEREGMKVNNK